MQILNNQDVNSLVKTRNTIGLNIMLSLVYLHDMNKERKPRILITNDDGIHAKGIQVLIDLLKPYGNLLVVAPDKGQSAMSHAITLNNPLHLKQIRNDENLQIYTCSGTSVDCVKLALNELESEKPDFLFSGINHGTNSSISIIYSGTMAAALEGSIHGITSIGLSVLDYSEQADFSMASHFSNKIVKTILSNNTNHGVCLNINFPKVSREDVKGIKICRQARSAWVESFDKRSDPHNRDYYWLTGRFHNHEPDAQDTDDWALRNNYISVVPVEVDFTAHDQINELKYLEQ
jgi:5'-nucleotidase